MSQHTESQNRAGSMRALSIMGWFELLVSAVFFVLQLPIVAVCFAFGSVAMSTFAVQAYQRKLAYDASIGQPPPAAPTAQEKAHNRTMFIGLMGAASALVIGALVFVVLALMGSGPAGAYGTAAVLGAWAVALASMANRYHQMYA